MEILVLLMDEFGTDKDSLEKMDQVSEDLIERGYTEQEINTAFYWLHHRFHEENAETPQKTTLQHPADKSHRVLHAYERRHVTPEAFGHLLQLRHLDLITWQEMEEIIERLLILGIQSASVDDVKAMVQSVLFEEGNTWGGSLFSHNASGKTETYH
jgi:uncharacterized protein Smg (DUF494 family)